MGKISMNYWSDSNGFFYDNTINTPLYHLMTMFCKIMQRECFFFPSEKPVHGFVIPSVVNATAFDITQPLVLLVSIDCINPQGWSLLSLIPSLIYCHLLVLSSVHNHLGIWGWGWGSVGGAWGGWGFHGSRLTQQLTLTEWGLRETELWSESGRKVCCWVSCW